MAMDLRSISNLYTNRLIENMLEESVILPNYRLFVDTVNEYKGLTRWHWKRKRELEPVIASLSVKIAGAIEKYEKEHPVKVKFKRFS